MDRDAKANKRIEGVAVLSRHMASSDLWLSERFTRAQALVDLILLANDSPRTFYTDNGVRRDVNRGQIAWSLGSLAQRWRWTTLKARTFLKELESEDVITRHSDNAGQIITLKNYEVYNGFSQEIYRDLTDDCSNGCSDDCSNGSTGKCSTEWEEGIGIGNNRAREDLRSSGKAVAASDCTPPPASDSVPPDRALGSSASTPSMEEFLEWGKKFGGHMALGIPKQPIPSAWLLGWYQSALGRVDGFIRWQQRAQIAFIADWRARKRRALGLDEPEMIPTKGGPVAVSSGPNESIAQWFNQIG